MRNTSDINGLNVMNINNINDINIETTSISTTNITAISLTHNCNDSQQQNSLPVAIKSQPKPKTRCPQSSSRQTKRPPSERRFKCDQCERMFFTRKDVKRHLVVHTGIRNFACPYCTQRFGRKDHLVRHAKKSHNRDTRSSTTIRTSSATHTSNKTNALPTLIQPKNNNISILGQQMTNNSGKHSFNCFNSQNGDHSTLVLLTNSNNNDINNSDNHCSRYANHSNICNNNSNNIGISGMHANESLYMSGAHSFDEMITSNTIKSETTAQSGAHYFAFPVNSMPLTYHSTHSSFLPNCFVTNSSANVNSCGSTAAVAAFGIPVSVCGEHSANSNPIHTNFLDVNPSLPHFNQAFQ
jgi:uncharacterized C2H2 Zn-finger protein